MPSKQEPIITMVAPKRTLLAMSPWLRMPPSAMMGLVATGAPLQRAELPAAGAKTGLQLGDAHLAGAHAHLGRIGAPVFQVNHRLGRGHIAGNHEGLRQLLLEVANHVLHAVGMAVGDVDGDVFGHQALGHELVHRVVVGLFHPREIDA